MSFSLADYPSAPKQMLTLSKTSSRGPNSFAASHFFDVGGFPAAGAASPSNTTTGVVPTDATTGAPTIQAKLNSAKQLYLSAVEAQGFLCSLVQNCVLEIYDLLFWAGATTIPTTGATTVTLSGQPSYASRVPFKGDGVTRDYSGLSLFAFASTAWGNQAHSVSVTYTDQDGNAGASTGNVSTQSRVIGSMLRLPFASGDNGVQKIDSYVVNGVASATGTVSVAVVRRLASLYLVGGQVLRAGPLHTGCPEVFEDSCLMGAVFNDCGGSGGSFAFNAMLELTES